MGLCNGYLCWPTEPTVFAFGAHKIIKPNPPYKKTPCHSAYAAVALLSVVEMAANCRNDNQLTATVFKTAYF